MSRLVCWFSCGAASAVATKLAIQQYKDTHEIVIARCLVAEEHEDIQDVHGISKVEQALTKEATNG
jgi:hypothetical protein